MSATIDDLTTSRLGELLTDPERRADAAIALGRRGAREYSGPIAAVLPTLKGAEHAAFVVALEMLGDPSVVPALLEHVDWAAHHALVRLTGRDPLVTDPDNLRQAWANIDLTAPARPEIRVGAVGATRADLTLRDGLGRFRVGFRQKAWPRWNRSLLIDGVPVYDVGSTCGTCETLIALTGWPAGEVASVSARLRDRIADVTALDDDLVDALRPMLVALPSGHYRLHLLDLDLELVHDPAASWWQRRHDERQETDDEPFWPGTGHFQLRRRIPGPVPTYGVVMPSSERRDPDTVAVHRAAIEHGARPAALLWGWVDDRHVEMAYPERFLVSVVLDGHHKLVAYAEAGVPARAVFVTRLEDNWGPPGERDRYLDEVISALPALR
ncbi:hypothetical protein [Actinophytocola sp. NPDC049390]|uniref:hypothetical protein n=1 Tax=Actinophytocola sp. NPDC049390 TaxID=3363894 RepID=UPI00379D5603